MDQRRSQPLTIDSSQRLPLQVKVMGQRGRGVVATHQIRKGDLIERSPVLIIPASDRTATDATVIFTYVFMWEHDTIEEDLYRHEGRAAIALGYTPNCDFVRHIDALVIDLVAARDIEADEELTIDYQMTLWFEPEP
jgi:uncharacterized protein